RAAAVFSPAAGRGRAQAAAPGGEQWPWPGSGVPRAEPSAMVAWDLREERAPACLGCTRRRGHFWRQAAGGRLASGGAGGGPAGGEECAGGPAGSPPVGRANRAEHPTQTEMPARGQALPGDNTVSLPPLVTPAAELTVDEVKRYSRHLIIPEIGMTGQKRLKN